VLKNSAQAEIATIDIADPFAVRYRRTRKVDVEMTPKRICLALDLQDDSGLIAEYRAHHEKGKVWPEIEESLERAGILDMEIYCTGNRLFMIMEVAETFSPEVKKALDASNPKVEEWERLMSAYQVPLPWAEPGEKWVTMERIFKLKE
jgi:L-rhamnose mutarotase